MPALEEARSIEEDIERIEQGIADRVREEPKHIRNILNRDHEVAQLLKNIEKQANNLIGILQDDVGSTAQELEDLSVGDPFTKFYGQLNELREYQSRYPNEQAENPEQRYRPKFDPTGQTPSIVDSLFSGEEQYGKYFDLNTCHDEFLSLPNVKHLSYLQYLEEFDNFTPSHGGVKRTEKLKDQYFKYVGNLADYLTSFRKRTKPLEDVDKVLTEFDDEFNKAWEKDEIPGWQPEGGAANGGPKNLSSPDAVWCDDCEKEFKNENVYKGHLTGRKHIKAAEARKQQQEGGSDGDVGGGRGGALSTKRIKEKAVAEREYRVKRLASAMSTERSDTRVNVERKQGMTEREREQELENIFNVSEAPRETEENGDEEGEEGDEKIYNPLKLPLAWDGKPIPFWLYRLHGLGAEFNCEICGNFVYMGRRAFDKHFSEPRHIYGLKCLGITNVTLFRDITRIDEALKLWDRIQQEQKKSRVDEGSIVQMEDSEGNVMPEKVYLDLQKQGLL
ncbi:splicing factor 3a subunit 3 [Purpureocillium lavendulum]|uniref:Splicing factor 3a subunit 3 n=1 Tax=Purpureocillium lavendulum TaxID=1247861 RepID=A0AB34FG87_9HYPO|nr:splicing factor 3a subunit 3 [Purpureocillium lavendulum]